MNRESCDLVQHGPEIKTPWGMAQSATRYGDGLVFFTTASHGGFELSRERLFEVIEAFPGWRSFAGGRWLEEDCDWAVAALLWPDLFTREEVFEAVGMAGGGIVRWEPVKLWLASDKGAKVRAIAAEFKASIAGKWRRGALHGGATGWKQFWMLGAAVLVVRSAGYPAFDGNWKTEAELLAMGATAE